MTDYTAALKISPKTATSLYGRGLVYQLQNESDNAARDIAAAKEIDPDIANAFLSYGVPDQ